MTPRIEVAGELLSDPAAMVLDSVRTMAATLVVRVPWLDATEREAHSVVLYLAAVEGAGRGAGGSGATTVVHVFAAGRFRLGPKCAVIFH